MRKTYYSPKTKSVDVRLEQMVATSGVSEDGKQVGGFGTGEGSLGDAATKSSDYNVWNDDWSR